MNLSIYKPNSKNSGCAARFQISEKAGAEPTFYLNLIAQHSWDESKKTGSFAENRNDPTKNASIKFNEFELGEIANAFQQKSSYSTYHTNETNKTSIRLSPFEKARGFGEKVEKYTAFGLAVTRNGSDSFKVPIEPGEAVRLIAFINKYYSVLDETRKKIWEENGAARQQAKKNVEKTAAPAAPVKPAQPEGSEEFEF